MNRRRADTAHPYPGIAPEDLTEAQRVAMQDAIVERYLGRKDREAWDRQFERRGRKTVPFIRRRLKMPRIGHQRGSHEWRL